MYMERCVFYSSINEANAKCYIWQDKIAPRLISSTCFLSFLSGSLLRFLSVLRLVSDFSFTSRISFFSILIVYDASLKSFFNFAASLVSDIQVFCFICQIASHLMFIISLVSDSGSNWLNTKTAYFVEVSRSHCRLFYTLLTVYLCICIPAGLLYSQTTTFQYSLEMYGQASLFGCSYY